MSIRKTCGNVWTVAESSNAELGHWEYYTTDNTAGTTIIPWWNGTGNSISNTTDTITITYPASVGEYSWFDSVPGLDLPVGISAGFPIIPPDADSYKASKWLD